MKFALCLSGDPRYFENTLSSIVKNIIDVNNCDVFAHFWIRDKNTLPHKTLIENGAPNVDFMAEHCREFIEKIKSKISFKKLELEINKYFPTDLFIPDKFDNTDIGQIKSVKRFNIAVQSQFYSVWKANELKKLYELENNFTYDGVMRLRPDILIDEKIDFAKFDLKNFYATLIDETYMYDHIMLSDSN